MKCVHLVLATVLLAAVGCGGAGESEPEVLAVAAAEAWLTLVDGGEYGASWQDAAGHFKAAVAQEDWERTIAGVRKPLGAMVSRTVKSTTYATSLPGAPDGEYVVIKYHTVFEHKSAAVETVTPMLDKDKTWRVSGYYVN